MTSLNFGVNGRAFLVTGGSRGLGFATAAELIDQGAQVLISGRSEASLQRATANLGQASSYMVGDNAEPDLGARLVETMRERYGRVDGALISVGGPPAGKTSEISDEQWRSAFESVFLGGIRIAHAVASGMETQGAISFVLSMSAKAPLPAMSVSNGLRAGLAMVAKSLADELGPRGIRVNGLLPGRIDTERIRELDGLSPDPAAAKSAAEAGIPLRRYGDAKEFGQVAAFTLSPAASYLSGAMLPIDGGLLRSL